MTDARPEWLLKQMRRLSSLRLQEHGPVVVDFDSWWSQIKAIADREGIETKPEDWTAWEQ